MLGTEEGSVEESEEGGTSEEWLLSELGSVEESEVGTTLGSLLGKELGCGLDEEDPPQDASVNAPRAIESKKAKSLRVFFMGSPPQKDTLCYKHKAKPVGCTLFKDEKENGP